MSICSGFTKILQTGSQSRSLKHMGNITTQTLASFSESGRYRIRYHAPIKDHEAVMKPIHQDRIASGNFGIRSRGWETRALRGFTICAPGWLT